MIFSRLMKKLLIPLLLSAAAPFAAAAPGHAIIAEEWAHPRSGEGLSQMESLRDAVREWMDHPDGTLVIRYPGGEEGGLWAGELRAWLVALGVDSRHIELWPGNERPDAVELEVRR